MGGQDGGSAGPALLLSQPNAPLRRGPRGHTSTRPLAPRSAPLRTGSRAQGGTLLRGGGGEVRLSGAPWGRSPSPAGRVLGPDRGSQLGGGCASTPWALGGDARKAAPGQHRCWPGLGRGSRGSALSVFRASARSCERRAGRRSLCARATSRLSQTPNPACLSLRQRCQGHRDWMSARFCPRLDWLKPLDKRVIDGTFRLYLGSAQPSYGSVRSGPGI